MSTETTAIVQRLWNYCDVLRDDGVSYGDYVEQLTYLLFLKMDQENVEYLGKTSAIPPEYNWDSLRNLEGVELEHHYRTILHELGRGSQGLLPIIFRKAQNRIQDPAKLRRLITLIDGEVWAGLDVDVKADIYEGLLEKNAQDVKSGAGQYFTPRPLIRAMVACMAPEPGLTICDPAAGTGGFLIAAHAYIRREHQLNRNDLYQLNHDALRGWEIVDNPARLCVMNLYLHGIGANGNGDGGESPITVADALIGHPGEHFDRVLTNPPFGKKSSVTIVTEEGETKRQTQTIERRDFWASTSNKQLNFLQHVYTLLEIGGQAAVVVPDNVLFEGGAGETVRRKLLHECDVHTLLRLPTGIFYAQGVKANVLFFDKRAGRETAATRELWIYDLRTNQHFTLKRDPLTFEDLEEFIRCYNPANRHERTATWSEDAARGADPDGRWRVFTYDELIARDKVNLDIFWIRDESLEETANLPDPDIIATDMLEDLESALDQLRNIIVDLEA